MKRLYAALACLLISCAALSGQEGFSLGAFLGVPTGLTAKLGLSGADAFEAKLAWDFSQLAVDGTGAFRFSTQLNYHLYFPGTFAIEGLDFPPFVGIGAEIVLSDGLPTISARMPFGIGYTFDGAPIELQLELGIGLVLFPAMAFRGSGGLAIRWVF
jgi:hypothetical protein